MSANSPTIPGLVDLILADDAALDRLADALADRLNQRLTPATPAADAWLDSTSAAEYLGVTRNALHKLTAARCIPFEQEGPGCKCWFKRPDLDAWRQGHRLPRRSQDGQTGRLSTASTNSKNPA